MKSKFWKKCHISAKLKVKLEKFFFDELPFNAIILANAAFTSWLFDRYIETILFLIAHYVLRYKFNKVFHCETDKVCLATTNAIIFISIPFIIPLEQSLLFSCISALGICWLGYLIQDRIELKYENSQFKKIKDTPVYYGMDEDILRKKCKQSLLTKLATERIILRYCYHYTIDAIAAKESVEYTTIKQSLRRSRKRLNIKEDID